MIWRTEERTGKGYEVQWYTDSGDSGGVAHADTIEELAQYLARSLWGSMRFAQNPTIWKDGERWCFNEYTEV